MEVAIRRSIIDQIVRDSRVLAEDEIYHVPCTEFYEGRILQFKALLRGEKGMMINRPLRPGDLVVHLGEECAVRYVNYSGAYVVPINGLVREIKGKEVEFRANGRMISCNSHVELVGCVEIGKDGKMVKRSRGKVDKGKGEPELGEPETSESLNLPTSDQDTSGVTFGQFAQGTPEPDERVTGSETVNQEGDTMAKSAKANKKSAKSAKGNGAARSAKAKMPKTVRNCACGCGGETTGSFVPGHDARFHGWLKKLADGRIDISGKDAKSGERIIPTSVIKNLDLVATKEGARAKAPHFYQEG